MINVRFDIDEGAWVINCLSCWGDGDTPQFLGQFADRRQALKFGDRHAHRGDMGTGLRTESWLAWMACEACGSTFTAWPVETQPLGGGRTYARRYHYDDFESISIRVWCTPPVTPACPASGSCATSRCPWTRRTSNCCGSTGTDSRHAAE